MTPSPPPLPWEQDYLRALVDPRRRAVMDHVVGGAAQLARLALLTGLGGGAGILATTMWQTGVLSRHALWHENVAALLWLWGCAVLLVELLAIIVRDAYVIGWPGRPPTGTRVLLRALGGFPALVLVSLVGPGWLTLWLQTGTAMMLFGWHVPLALRSWRTATSGLRSLPPPGPPASPAQLARAPGRLGRRLVCGRLTAGPGIALEGDGIIARLDPTIDAIHLDDQRGAVCVVAHVHVDDPGYRSAGLRLEPDGLPVWILAADGVEARLRGFRRRLRLCAALDSALIGTAVFGLAVTGACIAALLARR